MTHHDFCHSHVTYSFAAFVPDSEAVEALTVAAVQVSYNKLNDYELAVCVDSVRDYRFTKKHLTKPSLCVLQFVFPSILCITNL